MSKLLEKWKEEHKELFEKHQDALMDLMVIVALDEAKALSDKIKKDVVLSEEELEKHYSQLETIKVEK